MSIEQPKALRGAESLVALCCQHELRLEERRGQVARLTPSSFAHSSKGAS